MSVCGYDWEDGEGPCPESGECNECGRCSECCQDHNGWDCDYCGVSGWGDISYHSCNEEESKSHLVNTYGVRSTNCCKCGGDMKDAIDAGDYVTCEYCGGPFHLSEWDGEDFDCGCGSFAAEGDSGCCICGADYGRYGHNPDPIKSSGRCCDTCNATVVIPARLSMMGFRSEEDEIMAQMYEIEDKANPSAEDLKNYANLETRMYELTRMSSEYEDGWDGGHGEEYCHICMSVGEPIMSDEWCDGCEMALCDDCFGDIGQETCQSCRELDKSEMASEDNTPIMPPMDFGDMVNWRPLDGTPGLKRNRAEGVTEEVTNRLQRMALGFTGMTVVFTAVGAIGGYLLGRNTKR